MSVSPPPVGEGLGPVEPGPPPGAAGAAGAEPPESETSTGADDETTAGVAEAAPRALARPAPTPELRNLWSWAKGYIRTFHWALAPVWLSADIVPGAASMGIKGCCCKDGEGCTAWGKHLVSGLGVAYEEDDVEEVWPTSHPQVMAGHIGLAVMTGSTSGLLAVDVGKAARMTRARFKIADHILTQTTPSGGEHWFFQIDRTTAVVGGRKRTELVAGVLVLGDGTFAVLGPRTGYAWVGGAGVLTEHGISRAPEALILALSRDGMVKPVKEVHRDDAWKTAPGTPLIGTSPRTYTRLGDIRRLVDWKGDRITYTPALGFKVWGPTGWGDAASSLQALKSYVSELPVLHRDEAEELKAKGNDAMAKDALKWSTRSASRATASVISDLESDDRILVPSATDWDSEGHIAGLPVSNAIGRLVNLRTGEIERDAITRRVSKSLGADYDTGPGGDLKLLWDKGVVGKGGRHFVRYISDLTRMYGSEWVRLLQRAAGASLFGRRGVDGDVDAVFCLKGPTRSGKSTFAECLIRVAGDYGKAVNAPLLFGDRGSEFHVAGVFGYRLMTFAEPPLGERLNTTMLKTISGGDTLTGRLPYAAAEISFVPECSLWLSTNHALEVSDEAVWRRLRIFEFEHSIGEGAEDPRIRAALTGSSADPEELRLALAWMVHGAQDWAAEGWGNTEVWDLARGAEKSKHDPLSRWALESLTVTGSVLDTFSLSDLMTVFDFWVAATGTERVPLTRAALRDELSYTVVKAGVKYDKRAKLFVGGVLR